MSKIKGLKACIRDLERLIGHHFSMYGWNATKTDLENDTIECVVKWKHECARINHENNKKLLAWLNKELAAEYGAR